MRVIVAGGRNIVASTDLIGFVCASLRKIGATSVVSGGARGADYIGELSARVIDIPVDKHPADWDRIGRAAGMQRNEDMARCADALIALPRGSGTDDMIRRAQQHELPVYLLNFRGSLTPLSILPIIYPDQQYDSRKKGAIDMATKKSKKGVKKVVAKKVVKKSKPVMRQVAPKVKAKKRGRPFGSKNKPKTAVEGAPEKKGKRGRKFTLKPATPLAEIRNPDVRARLPLIIAEIRDLDEVIKSVLNENAEALTEINAQKADLLAEAVDISKANKLEAVEGDDWRMSYVAGTRSTLDQVKLLEAGVSMATIKACIVKTKIKPYVKISSLQEVEAETEG